MDRIEADAIRNLLEHARTQVKRKAGRTPMRSALCWLTRGRVDKRPRYLVGQLPDLGTPWQDTVSGRYFGWRCRQANLDGSFVFAVEYVICKRCNLGWVDKPFTIQEYQRRGMASTALRALREDNPGMRWHTGSGHMSDAKQFWSAVGDGVPGGYLQREFCAHVARDGGSRLNFRRK